MITRLDYISKQVLIIESGDIKNIRIQNSNIVVKDKDGKIILQHSLYKILLIFIIGDFSLSSIVIKKAQSFSFPIICLNFNLKPYFIFGSTNKGNFLLRRKQYTNKSNIELAKFIISNKVLNQILLTKSLRYKTENEKQGIATLEEYQNKIDKCVDEQQLLGIEGNASKIFFKIYFKNLDFQKRLPRTKVDIFNLLFDIGYSYLFNFIKANLEYYGFDLFYGFYHKLFYQRESLVCDLIEPFRCIVDRAIKKGFNLKQIDKNDFYVKNGQYYIKSEFNKKYSSFFIKEILSYKNEIFLYVQGFYRCFIKSSELSKYPKFFIVE